MKDDEGEADEGYRRMGKGQGGQLFILSPSTPWTRFRRTRSSFHVPGRHGMEQSCR